MRDRRKACATKDNEYFKAHEERERKKLAETNKRQEEECVEFRKIRENNEKMMENNLKLEKNYKRNNVNYGNRLQINFFTCK
jgi:hypothetical protein